MSRIVMRFTGVGGQGVLLAGEIFAAAKIKAGGYGVKTATYTSQVRGGPSRYWFTIGLTVVFSLGGWSPHIQSEFHVFRLTH
jgi:Pyruvate/2-oxoacid:ferredoxin oxidoreductase gamma subunit